MNLFDHFFLQIVVVHSMRKLFFGCFRGILRLDMLTLLFDQSVDSFYLLFFYLRKLFLIFFVFVLLVEVFFAFHNFFDGFPFFFF
jgi:hypothetical protein